jgi:hypothetical protein
VALILASSVRMKSRRRLAAHAQQLDDYVHNEGHKIVSVALNKFFSAAVAIAASTPC